MGYTHYWRMDEPLKVSKIQRELINEILHDHASVLDVTANTPKLLHFNGIGDESHEDLYIEYGKKKDFDFCKTARKPYDIAVCKVLLVLALSKGFNLSSDGTDQNNADETFLGDESWPNAQLWFVQKGFEDTITKKIIPYLNDPSDK